MEQNWAYTEMGEWMCIVYYFVHTTGVMCRPSIQGQVRSGAGRCLVELDGRVASPVGPPAVHFRCAAAGEPEMIHSIPCSESRCLMAASTASPRVGSSQPISRCIPNSRTKIGTS